MLALACRIAMTLAITYLMAFGNTAAAAPGWVGGRLLVTQDNQAVSLDQAEAAAGAKVGLELRTGRTVIVATLDENGYFMARGEPGTYRVEYLLLGKRAEFFAPHELVLRAGTITCAGTIAIEASPIESLGSNVKTPVEIRDECEQAWPHLRQLAAAPGDAAEAVTLARPGPRDEHPRGLTVRDLMVGLRAEAGIGSYLGLRGMYRLPLQRLILVAEGGLVYEDLDTGVAAYEVAGGAGYHLLGPFDGLVLGGVRVVAGDGGVEPVVGGALRLTGVIVGIGLRLEALPRPAALFTLDIAPLGVLGALL